MVAVNTLLRAAVYCGTVQFVLLIIGFLLGAATMGGAAPISIPGMQLLTEVLSLFNILVVCILMFKGAKVFWFKGHTKWDYARKYVATEAIGMTVTAVILLLGLFGIITLPVFGLGLIPLAGAVGLAVILIIPLILNAIYGYYCIARYYMA